MRTCFIMAILQVSLLGWGQNNIRSYEYWFNGNYAAKQQQTVVPAPQVTLNTGIATTALPPGLHLLHLRFQDDSAMYSATISQFFYKYAGSAANAAPLSAYQYWFDQQFSHAVQQPVAADNSWSLTLPVSAAALPDGLHLFHIRFKDDAGRWSSTLSHFFYKTVSLTGGNGNQLLAYQYWFDNYVSNATTVQLPAAANVALSAAIPTATLSKGLHLLHLRFQDQYHQWSAVISQFVYNTGAVAAATGNNLRQMQFWFDGNISQAQTKTIQQAPVVQVSDMIDAGSLTDGLHTLQVRFADSLGQWSSTISQFFYKSAEVGFTSNIVTGYRYWFNDDDAGQMVFHGVPEQTPFTLHTSIDMGCLPLGTNRLHIQFLDKTGLWSSTLTDTISVLSTQTAYRFTGNGNWSNAANWQNNAMPALDVPGCKEIIIDHAAGGSCILDVPQYLLKNARLTVLPGKHLIIPETLQQK